MTAVNERKAYDSDVSQQLLLGSREFSWGRVAVYVQLYRLSGMIRSLEEIGVSAHVSFTGESQAKTSCITVSASLEGNGVQAALLVEVVPVQAGGFKTLCPGLWYWGNRFTTAEAPSEHLGESWSFREDRLSIPAVCARTDTSLLALFNTGLPEADALEGPVVSIEHMQIGSIAFIDEPSRKVLQYRRPYQETPYAYVGKYDLAPPVFSTILLEQEHPVEIEVTVCSSSDEGPTTVYDQLHWVNRIADQLYHPDSARRNITDEQILDVMKHYYRETYYDTGSGICGFVGKEMAVSGKDLRRCEFEVGFIGRVLRNAAFSIEYGLKTAASEYIAYGRSIINSFTAERSASGWFRESYIGTERRWDEPDRFFLRRQSEGALAIVDACTWCIEKQPEDHIWYEHARTVAENIIQLQETGEGALRGSIPFSFDDRGHILDDRRVSTPSAVPLLIEFYPGRALLAGEYVLRSMIDSVSFHSSSLDSHCEDKESGIIVLTAMCQLHKLTSEKRWLNAAVKTADYVLSWYYCWDVPMPKDSLLGSLSFRTSGWGNVSVENNHIDCYLFDLPENLQYLSEQTQDAFYQRKADFIYDAIVERLLEREGHSAGIQQLGMIPEVVQHTKWNYGTGSKGSYNDISAFGWTHASIWEAVRKRVFMNDQDS